MGVCWKLGIQQLELGFSNQMLEVTSKNSNKKRSKSRDRRKGEQRGKSGNGYRAKSYLTIACEHCMSYLFCSDLCRGENNDDNISNLCPAETSNMKSLSFGNIIYKIITLQIQKLRPPLPNRVGAQGYESVPISKPVVGQNIALHAMPAYRASTYLVSVFTAHSTSFSPNVVNPQQ